MVGLAMPLLLLSQDKFFEIHARLKTKVLVGFRNITSREAERPQLSILTTTK